MKGQKGISIIKLIIIVAIVIIAIVIFASNQGEKDVKIEWGYMPSTEYYELKLAATQSEVYGTGSGTLSLSSFNTLGRDVKNAGGKWFKDSNVNFKASVLEMDSMERVFLTDGKHTAIFSFIDGNDGVYYYFVNEDHTGYKITIK